MGNKRASKRLTARRAAAFLATLGVLVMSSGVALMVAATPANASHNENHDPKVVVCKYVSTPGGVISHIVVVSENTLSQIEEYTPPADGDQWTDAQGQGGGSIALRYAADGPPPEQAKDIALSECPSDDPEPVLATATVTPVQPSCENGNVASYVTGGANVTFSESAAPAPGASITVTATATGDAEFEGGGTTQDFPLVFDAAEADCVIVDPPGGETPTVIVDPPGETPTVTPTVVSAGLGEVGADLRGEQGLALIFAGMVLMVAAGGLGLRGRTSRI